MQGTTVKAAETLLRILPERDYEPREDYWGAFLDAATSLPEQGQIRVVILDALTVISVTDTHGVLVFQATFGDLTPDAVIVAALDAVERDCLGIDRQLRPSEPCLVCGDPTPHGRLLCDGCKGEPDTHGEVPAYQPRHARNHDGHISCTPEGCVLR